MALATWQDVESRLLGRTLSPDEQATVTIWIEDLSSDIRKRIPDVDARVAEDPDFANTVKRVITASIKRVLDNPKGLRQRTVSIDDYSTTETVDTTASSGALFVSDEDWGLLTPATASEAFTIRPYGAPDSPRQWLSTDLWSPL